MIDMQKQKDLVAFWIINKGGDTFFADWLDLVIDARKPIRSQRINCHLKGAVNGVPGQCTRTRISTETA